MVARKLTDEERPRCSCGCGELAMKRGLAGRCYRRARRQGTLPSEWLSLSGGRLHTAHESDPKPPCRHADGCIRVAWCDGLCERHYRQSWRAKQRERTAQDLDGKLEEMVRRETDPPWVRHPQAWDT